MSLPQHTWVSTAVGSRYPSSHCRPDAAAGSEGGGSAVLRAPGDRAWPCSKPGWSRWESGFSGRRFTARRPCFHLPSLPGQPKHRPAWRRWSADKRLYDGRGDGHLRHCSVHLPLLAPRLAQEKPH